jgi:hypothetical protein
MQADSFSRPTLEYPVGYSYIEVPKMRALDRFNEMFWKKYFKTILPLVRADENRPVI